MMPLETARKRLARQITLVLWLMLIGVLVLETLWLSGLPAAALLFVVLVKSLPLLIALFSFRQAKPLTPVWLAILLLPYLCWAIIGLWVPGPEGMMALIRTLLITGCITGTIVWGWREKPKDAA